MRAVVLLLAGCHFHAGTAAPSDAEIDASIDAPADAMADAMADATPDAPPPPIEFVQAVAPGYVADVMVSVPITATTGNLIVAATYTSLIGTQPTITDSAGLTWTPLTAREATASCAPRLQLWYAFSTTSLANTVTLALPSSSYMGMHLLEYSGVTAAPVLAEAGQVAPASTNMATTGDVITPGFGVTVTFYADLSGAGTITVPSPWTARAIDTAYYTLEADNIPGTIAGTITPGATLPATDNCWTATAAAFR
jgi:hypothetical protein